MTELQEEGAGVGTGCSRVARGSSRLARECNKRPGEGGGAATGGSPHKATEGS
ncbi:hypothetical protein L7F22_010608, partial [Adiantum nelumboides]|nr:hypothetical protein [Adiantum nelumboides]